MDQNKSEAGLLQKMAAATSLEEQKKYASELEDLRQARRRHAQAEADSMWADKHLETYAPEGSVLANRSPLSHGTDWLADIDVPEHSVTEVETRMRAEASAWWSRVPDFVKEDPHEVGVQAAGLARRTASQYGTAAEKGVIAFYEQIRHLAEVGNHPKPHVPGENVGKDTETSASDTPSLAEGTEPEGDGTADAPVGASEVQNLDAATWPAQTEQEWKDGQEYPGKKTSSNSHEPCPNSPDQWYDKSTGNCSCGSNHRTWASPQNPGGYTGSGKSASRKTAAHYQPYAASLEDGVFEETCERCAKPITHLGDGVWGASDESVTCPSGYYDHAPEGGGSHTASRKTASGPTLDQIMAYEQGEMESREEVLAFFQALVDSGMAWSLQGHYGRTARDLIDAGLVTASRKTAAQDHEIKAWLNEGEWTPEQITDLVKIIKGLGTDDEDAWVRAVQEYDSKKTASRKTAAGEKVVALVYDRETKEVYDRTFNWETAESMAGEGYVAVAIDDDGDYYTKGRINRLLETTMSAYEDLYGVERWRPEPDLFSISSRKTAAWSSIEEIKRANEAAGNYFFSPGAMSFFNSKIESGVIGGRYFITSEYMDDPKDKKYTIRVANDDGTVDDHGEFQAYDTLAEAEAAARAL